MRRAINQAMTLLLVISLCASIVGAATVTSPKTVSSIASPVNIAALPGEAVKITVPTVIRGIKLNPGQASVYDTRAGFEIKDKFAFVTLGDKNYQIGPSSEVKKTTDGDLTGKTGDNFQLGRFKPGQIPAGVTFKFSPPDKMTFGKDSEGKSFSNPSTGKFLPTFTGGKQELQIISSDSGVKVKTDGTLTLLNVPGKPVTMSSDGTSEVSFKNDKGNTVLSGKGFQIGSKERIGQAGPLTFNQDGEVMITSTGQVIAIKGDPSVADGKAIVKTPPFDPKELSSKPDGSTVVRSKKTEQGTTDFLLVPTTDPKTAVVDALGGGPALISIIGPDGLTGTVTDKPSTTDGKTKPGEAVLNTKTGDVALNPGEAKVSFRSSKGLVAATGEGDLRFNLNNINNKKLNFDIGDLKLEDGEFKGLRLPETDLTVLIGTNGKAAAKVDKSTVSKSANPATTPPAPAAAQAPAESSAELNSWYTSKTGQVRMNNFIRALNGLEDSEQARQWKSAIAAQDYVQIKKIQQKIGTMDDGKLGGGSLRALNSYAASMKAPVMTEDDKYEPAPSPRPTTTATAPAKEPPARERVISQPDQSQLGIRIAESRQRQIAMINELPSSVLQAAESGGIPISEISTRLGRSTQTPKIKMEEPTPLEEIESLKFSGTLTPERKRYTRNAYEAQQTEKMKVTHSTINPAVARLPTVKTSEAPKNAQAGDALMRPEGRSVFIWLKYNRNTGDYISQDDGQSYTPLQVATRDSRIIR